MSVYLDPEVMRALSTYAARRRQPMSLIAEAAIASFLSPDADEQREAAIAKRLDQADRRLARIERDVGIAVETLALFIRFWLTTTPPLPEPAAKVARAHADARYDSFVVALGQRLSSGPQLRQEVSEEMGVSPPRHPQTERNAQTRHSQQKLARLPCIGQGSPALERRDQPGSPR